MKTVDSIGSSIYGVIRCKFEPTIREYSEFIENLTDDLLSIPNKINVRFLGR